MDEKNIQRFVMAQLSDFNKAYNEISNGHKEPGSHWMWYIFPQISGLGKSDISVYYSFDTLEEVQAYLNNSYLKNNLIKISEALLKCSDNVKEVFPFPDDLKIHSSMTLFHMIAPEITIFKNVLIKFWDGNLDPKTAEIVNNMKSFEKKDGTVEIKILQGDITKFIGDAIVNAANSSLLGGGGVDGAIHRAAGPELLRECYTLNGCNTGDSKITKGYNLPVKYVIHTVGPVFFEPEKDRCKSELESCYRTSIKLAIKNGVKSIAYPLISAGIYGYPKNEALQVAIEIIKLNAPDDMKVSIIVFDKEIWNIAQTNYPELCE